jgi:rubrerythrin
MELQETVELAVQMEDQMSKCYEELIQLSPDKTLAEEFDKLAKEEIDHKNLLQTGLNYINQAPELFEMETIDRMAISNGLNQVTSLHEKIKNKTKDFIEALNDIYELEQIFEKLHFDTFVQIHDASLKDLFKSLSQDDKEHKLRLLKAIKSVY